MSVSNTNPHISAIQEFGNTIMSWLLIAQYTIGILIAIIISPLTWAGTSYAVHNHVLTAILYGAAVISLPVYLTWRHRPALLTRHVIAAAQMLMGALLIHLTGGRIETHFHVFVSLAFLAMMYSDWKVIATATVVVATEHLFRGIVYPMSVFGTEYIQIWRVIEHASWVLFEDGILIYFCIKNQKELLRMHTTSVELQDGLAIMRQRLEQLAAGDIRSHVDTHESNILHQLFTDFNICMDQLTALIAEAAYVSTLTNDIGSSINAATIQIAQSMEEQSALISGVASAAEEMTSNLSESSTNTMYATNIARECSDSAKNSGAIVRESITSLKNMVDSITGISTIIHELELKSTKIEDILVVIREIAAQTNLLALNAAIEAARAGEQGRGFAVVADEVRKLAERTQRETQEVADVVKGIRMETHNAVEAINTTVTEVDRGRTSSEDASAAIDQILSQTEQVFALVNNINEISKQQEVASSEVARSITSISDASQLATQSTHGISNDTTKLLLASRTLHSLLQKFSTGQGVNVIEQDTSDAPTIIHTSQLVKSQQYMPVVNSTQKHALLL